VKELFRFLLRGFVKNTSPLPPYQLSLISPRASLTKLVGKKEPGAIKLALSDQSLSQASNLPQKGRSSTEDNVTVKVHGV